MAGGGWRPGVGLSEGEGNGVEEHRVGTRQANRLKMITGFSVSELFFEFIKSVCFLLFSVTKLFLFG